jgi:hypothetical protein
MIRLWDETATAKSTLFVPVTHRRARAKRAQGTAPTDLAGKMRALARKVNRRLARSLFLHESRSRGA